MCYESRSAPRTQVDSNESLASLVTNSTRYNSVTSASRARENTEKLPIIPEENAYTKRANHNNVKVPHAAMALNLTIVA